MTFVWWFTLYMVVSGDESKMSFLANTGNQMVNNLLLAMLKVFLVNIKGSRLRKLNRSWRK